MYSRRTTFASVALSVLIVASGCSPDVAKMRTEQDANLEKDRRGTIAQYKARFEANSTDPVAAYMYGRIAPEARVQFDIGQELVKKHPDFAWGHFLYAAALRKRGDYEGWREQVQQASKLAPKEQDIAKAAVEASKLLVVDAGPFAPVVSAVVDGEPNVLSNLDRIEQLTRVRRGVAPGFEVLAAEYKSDGHLLMRLFVKNTSGSTFKVTGRYAGDLYGTCYTDDGMQLKPLEDDCARMHGRQNCLFSISGEVEVSPGAVAVPNGVFPLSSGSLRRCVFHGFPDTLLLVKLPA